MIHVFMPWCITFEYIFDAKSEDRDYKQHGPNNNSNEVDSARNQRLVFDRYSMNADCVSTDS